MISEELKAIVDKFKEQGKMYFLEETTEDKISVFEEEKGITLPSKNGCCFLMEASFSFQQVFNSME